MCTRSSSMITARKTFFVFTNNNAERTHFSPRVLSESKKVREGLFSSLQVCFGEKPTLIASFSHKVIWVVHWILQLFLILERISQRILSENPSIILPRILRIPPGISSLIANVISFGMFQMSLGYLPRSMISPRIPRGIYSRLPPGISFLFCLVYFWHFSRFLVRLFPGFIH